MSTRISGPDRTDGARRSLRWGGWAMAVAGLLTGAIFGYWMMGPDAAEDLPGAAAAAVNPFTIASGAIYLVALIVLLLGLVGLHAWLSRGPVGRWATIGLVSSVAAVGLLLAVFGAGVLAAPVVADVYFAGHSEALDALLPLSGGHFSPRILAYFGLAVVLAMVGAIADGVAIWRSGTLPRWAAIPFGLGLLLVALSSPVVTTIGGLLLIVAGVWLTRSVASRPTASPSVS